MQHNTICRHKYFRDEQCSFLIKTFNLMNLYFTLQSFLNDTIQCVLLMQWATYSKNGESWDEKYTLSHRIMPGTWKRPWRMQFFPTYVFENPLVGKICPAVQHRWNNSSWKKTSYLVYSHPVNRLQQVASVSQSNTAHLHFIDESWCCCAAAAAVLILDHSVYVTTIK